MLREDRNKWSENKVALFHSQAQILPNETCIRVSDNDNITNPKGIA